MDTDEFLRSARRTQVLSDLIQAVKDNPHFRHELLKALGAVRQPGTQYFDGEKWHSVYVIVADKDIEDE